jgi:YVTN family beta-propeller protein
VVDGELWVTLQDRRRVAVLDPETLVVTAEHPVGDRPWKVTAGLDSVWVTNQGSGAPGSVSRLDPDTGARLQPDVTVGLAPDEITVVDGRVYVANRGDGTVTELAG